MLDESEMMEKLRELSISLAEDLASEELKGKTLTLKLKTTDFRVLSRSKTVVSPLYKSEDILSVARTVGQRIVADPN